MQCTPRATPCLHWYCAIQIALRASSHCKHDMGTLLWLNAKLLQETLADLKGALPNGHSSTTLW